MYVKAQLEFLGCQLHLNVFSAMFQTTEPMLHHVRGQVLELLKNILSDFIRPDVVRDKDPLTLDVEAVELQVPVDKIYLGMNATHTLFECGDPDSSRKISPKSPIVLLIDGHLSHIDYNTTLFSFDKAARPDIIKSSFKCAGIWPVNRDQISPSMFAPSKTFQATTNASVDENGTKISHTNATSSTVDQSASSTSDTPANTEPSAASTPTKSKADSRHSVYRSMEQLEGISGVARVWLFNERLEEGYDVDDDAVYMAWKVLKVKILTMEKEMRESSIAESSYQEDLSLIIANILTYPESPRKEKKERKKSTFQGT
eukprot:gene4936-5583_t